MKKRTKKQLAWLLSFSLLSTGAGIWSGGGMQVNAAGAEPIIRIGNGNLSGTEIPAYPAGADGSSDIFYVVGLGTDDKVLTSQESGLIPFKQVEEKEVTKWMAVVKTEDQLEVVDWGSNGTSGTLAVKAGETISGITVKVADYKRAYYAISAMLVSSKDKNNEKVVAYGNIVVINQDKDTKKMTIDVPIPENISEDKYTLHLFGEDMAYHATISQTREVNVNGKADTSATASPTASTSATPTPSVSPTASAATATPSKVPTATPSKAPTTAPTSPAPTMVPVPSYTPVAATATPSKTLAPVPTYTPVAATTAPTSPAQTLPPVPSYKPVVPVVTTAPSVAPATAVPLTSDTPAVTAAPTDVNPAQSEAPTATYMPAVTTEPGEVPAETAAPEAGSTVKQENVTYKVTESGGVAVDNIAVTKNQTEVTIPDTVVVDGQECKVDTISAGAFSGNSEIEQVTLGKNIKKIEKKAFSGCKNLEKITLSNKVATVGAESFSGCTSLKKVTLPDSVKTIGAKAFKGCKSLKNVKIGKKAQTVKSGAISAVPYIRTSKNGVLTVETVPTYSAGASPALTIGNYAFAACSSMKKVIINSAVRVIGSSAFRGCKKLSDIVVNSQILETVRKMALKGINNCTITVPSNKFKPYRTLFRNKGQGKKVLIAKV